MNLFIDMGNSRLKWAEGSDLNDLMAGQPLLNLYLSQDNLIALWQALETPHRVLISQVSSDRYSETVRAAIKTLWPSALIQFAKSSAYACGLTNAYRQPEKLGIDRWLGMISGYQHFKTGFCLADCGTALTLDIVDAEGRHLGGLISPGLLLMKKSLALGAERLSLTTQDYPPGLADQTEAAIYNGTLGAACGLIERTLEAYNELPLIMTGGDAEIIAAALSLPAIIEPDLVLRGLALSETET